MDALAGPATRDEVLGSAVQGANADAQRLSPGPRSPRTPAAGKDDMVAEGGAGEALLAAAAGPELGTAAPDAVAGAECASPASLKKKDSGYGSMQRPRRSNNGEQSPGQAVLCGEDDDEPASPMDSEAPLLERAPPGFRPLSPGAALAAMGSSIASSSAVSLGSIIDYAPSEASESSSASGSLPRGGDYDPTQPLDSPHNPPKRSFSKRKGARLSVRTAAPKPTASEPLPTFVLSPAPALPSAIPHVAKDTDCLRENPYKYGPALILPYFYLGCKDNARDAEILASRGIRYLINVAKEVRNPLAGEGCAEDCSVDFGCDDCKEDWTCLLRACDDAEGEGKAVGEFGVCREVVVRLTVDDAPAGQFGAKCGDKEAVVEAVLIGRDTWPADHHSSHPPVTAVNSGRPSSPPLPLHDSLSSDAESHHRPPVARAEAISLSRATSEFFAGGGGLGRPRRMPSFEHGTLVPRVPALEHVAKTSLRSPSMPPAHLAHATTYPDIHHHAQSHLHAHATPAHSPRAMLALSRLPPRHETEVAKQQQYLHLHSLHLPWTHSQCIRRAPSPNPRPCEKLGWRDEMEYACAVIDHARLVGARCRDLL